MGLIAMEGMQFYAYHGPYHVEQVVGKQFQVDVYIRTDLSEAASKDELKLTINYEEIYAISKEEMKIRSNLLENVALRILNRLEKKYVPFEWMKVRVTKLHPPVKGMVEKVYVELERTG
ncbi:MAG: dihydroneopterin aldolase [Bacteroidetes bacterium]|nr:dihydroneopterin aldolase [Bacteroidota bacterium]